MKSKKIYTIFLLLSSITGVMVFQFGQKIPMDDQMDIYDSLKDFASIIFGVMGAWIAIVYPDALGKVFSKNIDHDQNLNNLKRLFIPMRISTFIVVVCAFIKWFYPLAKNINIFIKYKNFLIAFNFFFLGLLTLSLIFALVLSLLPMELAEEEVTDKTSQVKGAKRKSGRAQDVDLN